MKWYWWTLIGLAVVAIIIYFVWKSQNKTTVVSNEGTPCTLSTSRSVGPVLDLPHSTVGVIKNGVCTAI